MPGSTGWGVTGGEEAQAAGATEDEITDVLLAPQSPMWRTHSGMTSRTRWRMTAAEQAGNTTRSGHRLLAGQQLTGIFAGSVSGSRHVAASAGSRAGAVTPEPGCAFGGKRRPDGSAVGYHEILRRLAIVDEEFAGDQAGLGLGTPADRALDAKTAALVGVGALAAIGSPEVCLEWSATPALATGATEEEITGVLLAIAPVIGLGRITGAVPGVAAAFEYDIEAALDESDGP